MDSDASPTGSTSPLTRISPSVGATTPDTHLMSVDFPAPLGPSRQCTSPARTSKSTPLRASTPGYCFLIPGPRAAVRRSRSSPDLRGLDGHVDPTVLAGGAQHGF